MFVKEIESGLNRLGINNNWTGIRMATKTQNEKLLGRLGSGRNLTVTEAFDRFGVQRLAARIHELRNAGFRIDTNKINRNGRQVTAYRLITE